MIRWLLVSLTWPGTACSGTGLKNSVKRVTRCDSWVLVCVYGVDICAVHISDGFLTMHWCLWHSVLQCVCVWGGGAQAAQHDACTCTLTAPAAPSIHPSLPLCLSDAQQLIGRLSFCLVCMPALYACLSVMAHIMVSGGLGCASAHISTGRTQPVGG